MRAWNHTLPGLFAFALVATAAGSGWAEDACYKACGRCAQKPAGCRPTAKSKTRCSLHCGIRDRCLTNCQSKGRSAARQRAEAASKKLNIAVQNAKAAAEKIAKELEERDAATNNAANEEAKQRTKERYQDNASKKEVAKGPAPTPQAIKAAYKALLQPIVGVNFKTFEGHLVNLFGDIASFPKKLEVVESTVTRLMNDLQNKVSLDLNAVKGLIASSFQQSRARTNVASARLSAFQNVVAQAKVLAFRKGATAAADTMKQAGQKEYKSIKTKVLEPLQGEMLKNFTAVLGFREKLKTTMKDLLWMDCDDPFGKCNEDKIKALVVKQAKWVFFPPDFPQIVPPPLQTELANSAGTFLAQIGAPGIRWFQFIRTKMRGIMKLVMESAIRGINRADAELKSLLEKQLKIPARLSPFFLTVVKGLLDIASRTIGTFGSYALALDPKLKAQVMMIATTLGSVAEATNDAMGALTETASVLSGDSSTGELGDPITAARGLLGCRAFNASDPKSTVEDRCVGVDVTDLQGRLRAYDAAKKRPAEYAARRQDLALFMGQLKYKQAFNLKTPKVEAAVGKVFSAIRTAFVNFTTPVLTELAEQLNANVFGPLLRGAVVTLGRWILSLIFEVGGMTSGIWDFIASGAVTIVLSMTSSIMIDVTLDVIGEEVESLKEVVMKTWRNPAMRDDLAKFQETMKDAYELFKVAKTGLDGLREGLEEGAAAMLKGPIMTLLLKKLPPGLGDLIAAAAHVALKRLFDPKNLQNGQIQFDIQKILIEVLLGIKPKLRAFVLLNLPRASARYQKLVLALESGFDAAFGTALSNAQEQNNFTALLQTNAIRKILADFVYASADGFVDFLADEFMPLAATRGVRVPCATAFRAGLKTLIEGTIAPMVRSEKNELSEAFQGGIQAIIPIIVRKAFEKPASGPSDGPLVDFLMCNTDAKSQSKWRARILTAVGTAAAYLTERGSIDKLMSGGLPAAMGVLLKIVKSPVAGMLADGLNDPRLESDLATALNALGDKAINPAFQTQANALAKKMGLTGVKSILIELAGIPEVKAALVGFIVRRLNDPEFTTPLNSAYSGILNELKRNTALSDRGAKGFLEAALLPWARFAYTKFLTLLENDPLKAKAQLQNLVEALVAVFPAPAKATPALKSVAGVVVAPLDAGAKKFVAKARTECTGKIRAPAEKIFVELFGCLKRVFGSSLVSGGQDLIGAAKTSMASGGLAAAKSAITQVIDLIARNSGEAATKIGDLIRIIKLDDKTATQALKRIVADARRTGVKKFSAAARPACVQAFTGFTKKAAQATAKCLIDSARTGANTTVEAAIDAFLRTLKASAAAIQKHYRAHFRAFSAMLSPDTTRLLSSASAKAVESFATRARLCGVTARGPLRQRVVTCLDQAARAAASVR